MKKLWTLVCMATLILVSVNGYCQKDINKKECLHSFFTKSLHYTTEGMRYWYEKEGGFMNITGIPYDKLGCKKCHIQSCDRCHAQVKEGISSFSVQKARKLETCFQCHSREKLTIKLDKKKDQVDVHFASGMECVDCHTQHDIHGTGKAYKTMRDPGAVSIECMKCHAEDGEGPLFDKKLKAHRIHGKRLDCNACHVRSNMTCYNCHFEKLIETKKKHFIPVKGGLLLMNYNKKVTSANVMTLVYKGKKFIAYSPYFTHSIMRKGRECSDCHNNRAVRLLKAGKKIPVSTFKDGKLELWEGVVPVVEGKLKWVFLDWKDGKWTLMNNSEKPLVQNASFGTPLTERQLKKLYRAYGKKKKGMKKNRCKDSLR